MQEKGLIEAIPGEKEEEFSKDYMISDEGSNFLAQNKGKKTKEIAQALGIIIGTAGATYRLIMKDIN